MTKNIWLKGKEIKGRYITMNAFNIVGVISFIIAVFNKERLTHGENKTKYFNEFLVNFYASYRQNNDLNMEVFFNCNYSEIYIPPYVFYLFEKGKYEDLKKVLLVDYYIIFPNEKNSIMHTFNKFMSIIDLLYYFFVAFVLFGTIILGFLVFVQAIILREQINYINLGILGLSIIIYAIIAIIMKKHFITNDSYSYNKNIIDNIIKSKLEDYENISKELYFIVI